MSLSRISCSIISGSTEHWPTLDKLKIEDINADQGRISLAQEGFQHAVLFVEYFDHCQNYKSFKIDLRGKFFLRSPLQIFSDSQAMHFGFYRRGNVQVVDLSEKDIRYRVMNKQWIRQKADLLRLIAHCQEEKENFFNILGNGAISSCLSATLLNQRSNNCYTWARERLMMAGVNLKPHRHIQFFTATSLEAAHFIDEPMERSIRPLCHFARANNVEHLARWYTGSQLANKITWRQTKGPAEVVLGTYTPLMIAAAYGHHESVSFMLNKMHANPYINTQAGFCFGILGRYSAFDCAGSLIMRPYVSKKNRTKVQDCLNNIDHKSLIKSALDRYIHNRCQAQEYTSRIGFFGYNLINFGYCKKEKIKAAQVFRASIDDPSIDLLPYRGPLGQGELGKLFSDFQKYGKETTVHTAFIEDDGFQDSNTLGACSYG